MNRKELNMPFWMRQIRLVNVELQDAGAESEEFTLLEEPTVTEEDFNDTLRRAMEKLDKLSEENPTGMYQIELI